MGQSLFVGPEIHAGCFRAELPDELIVDEAVLRCDLGGGVSGHAAAQPPGFDQRAVHPVPGQQICAKKARHTAANDEDIGLNVLTQGRESGKRDCFFP